MTLPSPTRSNYLVWAWRSLRLALAWVFIWPAFLLYYVVTTLLVLSLLVCCVTFRVLLGPDPVISNCVLWSGWQWISQTWIDLRAGHSPPGGYLVIRWSKWGPFWHYGWKTPGVLLSASYSPPAKKRRWLPPPLFKGHVISDAEDFRRAQQGL